MMDQHINYLDVKEDFVSTIRDSSKQVNSVNLSMVVIIEAKNINYLTLIVKNFFIVQLNILPEHPLFEIITV